MPLYITVEDRTTNRSETHTFTHSPIRVGRNQMNDLLLGYGFVSEWHAIIRFDETQCHYIDLDSTNGSVVNGEKIPKNVLTPVGPSAAGPSIPLCILTVVLHFSRVKPQNVRTSSAGAVARVSRIYSAVAAPILDSGTGSFDTAAAQAAAAQHPSNPIHDMDGVLLPLRHSYIAYRLAWSKMQEELNKTMHGLTPQQQQTVLRRVPSLFPDIVNEPEFQAMTGQAPRAVPVPVSAQPHSALVRLATAFLPSHLIPKTAQDNEKFVGRIAGVLEGFSTALVELFKGHEQFGQQMAVQTICNPTTLQQSSQSADVLAYLLDWSESADGRLQELISAFADLMIHQVALINGIVDGAKGMLNTIHPDAIVRQADETGGMFRGNRYWQVFTERFNELIRDDSYITRSIFGHDFARAYAMVIGQQPPK